MYSNGTLLHRFWILLPALLVFLIYAGMHYIFFKYFVEIFIVI